MNPSSLSTRVFERKGLTSTQLEKTMNFLLDNHVSSTSHSSSSSSYSKQVHFLGVFPFDQFPLKTLTHNYYSSSPNAYCCIVNTDPSHKPGTHWVAFFIDKTKKKMSHLEFFDSYGLPPNTYSFKFPSPIQIISNQCTLQSHDSTVCGHYCILYLYLRSLIFYSSNSFQLTSLDSHCNVIKAIVKIASTPVERDKILPSIICKMLSDKCSLRNNLESIASLIPATLFTHYQGINKFISPLSSLALSSTSGISNAFENQQSSSPFTFK